MHGSLTWLWADLGAHVQHKSDLTLSSSLWKSRKFYGANSLGLLLPKRGALELLKTTSVLIDMDLDLEKQHKH